MYVADILVVEDSNEIMQTEKTVLEDSGYTVRCASTGKKALEAIAEKTPDLILLDITLPGQDGFSVCETVKQHDATKDVPIIFITALSDTTHLAKGFQLGAVDYIAKPFHMQDMLSRVALQLELSQRGKQLKQQVEQQNQQIKESEQRYLRIMDSIKDEFFFYAHNTEGILTYLSPSVSTILGYSKEELLAHYSTYFTDNPLNQQVDKYTKLALTGEEQPAYELEIYHKDGSVHWLEVKEAPVFSSNGEAIAIEGLAHDITERKEYQKNLLASQAHLEEAQHLGHMGHWDFDLQNNQLTWSKEVYRMLGIDSQSDISYELFLSLVHPDDIEKVKHAYELTIHDQQEYDITHRIIRKNDGEVRYVHERSKEERDEQGHVIRSVGTVQDITERVLLEKEQVKNQKRFKSALKQTIQAISLTLESRDPYTAGHQKRVSQLSCAIAKELGFNQKAIEGIEMGSLIHDIGKINLPAEILSKPSRLSETEWALIQTHSEAGYAIVKDINFPWPVQDIILQHHERLDGSGYPNGIKDDEIIPEARIVMVADVVEAMSSHRPYRPGKGIDIALEEIKKNRGTLFDAKVVDACLRIFENKIFAFD